MKKLSIQWLNNGNKKQKSAVEGFLIKSANDETITLTIKDPEKRGYRKGQYFIATVPVNRKTSKNSVKKATEVIASGRIIRTGLNSIMIGSKPDVVVSAKARQRALADKVMVNLVEVK